MELKAVWELLKATVSAWNEDKAPRLAAALAYYAIFSLAPLLIVVIWIAGLVFGQQAAQGHIVEQIQSIVGRNSAEAIQAMIKGASQSSSSGFIATMIGIVALLLGASGLFGQIKDALNSIWDVESRSAGGIRAFAKDKLLSFAMVLVAGFMLLLSVAVSTGLAIASRFLSGGQPALISVLQVLDLIVPFAIITMLFALVYKFLPDTKIAWRDVWLGALITSLLFVIGKFLIGLYLGHSSVGSVYGAAGSLVILLVWIYYSAQIFLFGAEFTWVFASKYGSRAMPARQ